MHRIEEEARRPEEKTHEAATGPKKAQRLLPSEREETLLPSSAFDEVAKLNSEARVALDLERDDFRVNRFGIPKLADI